MDAVMPEAAERRIDGPGTAESAWRQWSPLARQPLTTPEELVPPRHRAVVVAPHPDNEVLICGGLLSLLAMRPADGPVQTLGLPDGGVAHQEEALVHNLIERLRPRMSC